MLITTRARTCDRRDATLWPIARLAREFGPNPHITRDLLALPAREAATSALSLLNFKFMPSPRLHNLDSDAHGGLICHSPWPRLARPLDDPGKPRGSSYRQPITIGRIAAKALQFSIGEARRWTESRPRWSETTGLNHPLPWLFSSLGARQKCVARRGCPNDPWKARAITEQ